MARVKIPDILNEYLYLTFSCHKQMNCFFDEYGYEVLINQLELTSKRGFIDIVAYVVMPNHVHLIIKPKLNSISRILNSIKQPVSRKLLPHIKMKSTELYDKLEVRVCVKSTHRLWMRGGGYIRIIKSHDEIRNEIKYIHRNPVRKQWVEHPEQWRWSSFRFYLTGDPDPIPIDRPDWI